MENADDTLYPYFVRFSLVAFGGNRPFYELIDCWKEFERDINVLSPKGYINFADASKFTFMATREGALQLALQYPLKIEEHDELIDVKDIRMVIY
jgi:hypothetical protein